LYTIEENNNGNEHSSFSLMSNVNWIWPKWCSIKTMSSWIQTQNKNRGQKLDFRKLYVTCV